MPIGFVMSVSKWKYRHLPTERLRVIPKIIILFKERKLSIGIIFKYCLT